MERLRIRARRQEVLLHGCSRAEGDNWYRRPGKPGTYSRAVGVIYGSLRCAVS